MKSRTSMMRTSAQSALATALLLPVSLVLAFGAGGAVAEGLLGHMAEGAKIGAAAIVALAVISGGGALWGRAMSEISRSGERGRMTWAGGLSYGPAAIAAGIALSMLEVAIVERGGGPDLPVHIVFTLLFVPATFFVAAASGFALGLANRSWPLSGRLALFGGLAGGLAFLAVDLLLDALGRRVGAPGAAERATMLTVLLSGSLAAAAAGGGAIGLLLWRHVHAPVAPESAPARDAGPVETVQG